MKAGRSQNVRPGRDRCGGAESAGLPDPPVLKPELWISKRPSTLERIVGSRFRVGSPPPMVEGLRGITVRVVALI
jgi:hypothetical protein